MPKTSELILMEIEKEGKIYIAELAKRLGVSRPTIYYYVKGKWYKGKFYGGDLKDRVIIDKLGNLSIISVVGQKKKEDKKPQAKEDRKRLKKEEKIRMIEQGLEELENKEIWMEEDYDNYLKLMELKKKMGLDVSKEEEIYAERVRKRYEQN